MDPSLLYPHTVLTLPDGASLTCDPREFPWWLTPKNVTSELRSHKHYKWSCVSVDQGRYGCTHNTVKARSILQLWAKTFPKWLVIQSDFFFTSAQRVILQNETDFQKVLRLILWRSDPPHFKITAGTPKMSYTQSLVIFEILALQPLKRSYVPSVLPNRINRLVTRVDIPTVTSSLMQLYLYLKNLGVTFVIFCDAVEGLWCHSYPYMKIQPADYQDILDQSISCSYLLLEYGQEIQGRHWSRLVDKEGNSSTNLGSYKLLNAWNKWDPGVLSTF